MLYTDITLFGTADGVKHYQYVSRDNFTRALLACEASLEYSSRIAKQTLHVALRRHGLLRQEGELRTDGGSENCGAVTELLAKPRMLRKKLVAQLDIVQSNSIVEARTKIIEHWYLYRRVIATIDDLKS